MINGELSCAGGVLLSNIGVLFMFSSGSCWSVTSRILDLSDNAATPEKNR